MTDCIFCKIVNGEIPTYKIYEDPLNFAFLDINPSSLGHTIIIPKKHYQKLEEMPEEEAKELFSVIFRLAKIVPKIVETSDCNIGINNGKSAGQEIPHLQFHIIPRFEGDKGLPIQGLVRMEVKKEALPELAEKIKKEIENSAIFKEGGEVEIEDKKSEEKSEEPKKEETEERPAKSPERDWQEFNLEEQDKAPDFSEARRE